MEKNSRLFSLDLLRLVACYLVIQVHAGEFYYIGDGGVVLPGDNPYIINFLNSIGRTAVPLFVMITGFFVLPVKYNMSEFFKKRFVRVVVPFMVWCVCYALYRLFLGQADLETTVFNILRIPVNFGTEVGHLWYVYMLIGLYLFFPIISPWIQSASKKAMLFYLSIWSLSLFLPYIHLFYPEVLGECYWNNTPLLYYFSGLLGYAVLGVYLKKHCMRVAKTDILLGLVLLGVGLAVTILIFDHRIGRAADVSQLELSWGYGTFNVAIMSLGLFLLFKNLTFKGTMVRKIVQDMSNLSYGVYLAHIMVLNYFYSVFDGMIESVWLKLPVISILTFITTFFIVKLISFLPKSKYMVG